MGMLRLLVLLTVVSLVKTKPTTESTHAILKRLGFDPMQRSSVNHHMKRVVLEPNKARYHNDFYSSKADSPIFVVKLPPHSPFYSHIKPEKFKNEASQKPSKTLASFRTNGKPGQIYHWNIPILKKMVQVKKGIVRNANEDSKVYHIKILPDQTPAKYSRQDSTKRNKNNINFEDNIDALKPNKYQKHKVYRFSDSMNKTLNSAQQFPSSRIQVVSMSEKQGIYFPDSQRNPSHVTKKLNDKYPNDILKVKRKNQGPSFYVPTIPKQNSFYKYFSGNGKPKSFYVIEKSINPSKLHKLL